MRRGSLTALGAAAIWLLALWLVAPWLGALSPALAQAPHPLAPRAPVTAPAGAALAPEEPPGLLTRVTAWIHMKQRELHRDLIRHMRALSAGSTAQAAWALIVASFLYGVFHAVGPGHGKAVLATYLGTQPHRMRRGLQLAAGGALAQGLIAIALVYGLVIIGGWLPRDTQGVVTWSERLGYALVAAVGFALAWRGARALRGAWRQARAHRAHAHPAHAHPAHDHRAHAHHDHGHRHDHDHGHDHGHVHGPHCAHVHAPTPAMLATSGWRANLAIVLSMGMRPCTGAILVLVLAFALDLLWVGVAAVIAMSIGTGIALVTMGILVIKARQWAMTRLGAHEGQGHLVVDGLAFAGGCAVLLLGTSLLIASFGPAHPLGL